MKSLIFFFVCIVAGLNTAAQDFPAYGVTRPEELDMKECPFDKEAEAVILFHEASADHDDYKLITRHHVRIKILKESGIDRADVRIPFYSKDAFERIDELHGKIFNQNESGGMNFTELESKAFFKKNINKYWSEVIFTFPNVKVGSIFEYTYVSTMQSYGGLEDWTFQDDIPVVRSKYSVVMLPNYEFAYRVQKREDYEIKVTPDKSSGKITFEMKNIPGLPDEPYMDARKDYVQRVIFQLSGSNVGYRRKYSTTWAELIRELWQEDSFGGQLGKTLSGSEAFIKEMKLEPVKINRLVRIYEFVRSTMSWNGFSGIYSSDGIKSAWNKKTGNGAEINLILATLLREAEIEAFPLLASERSNGKVKPEYPFRDQFNRVYVYAEVEGKKFYLNAMDKYTSPFIIPYNILNTSALIVSRKTGGLVDIRDEKTEYRDYMTISGAVSEDGTISGSVFISSSDYAKSTRLSTFFENRSGYMNRFTNGSDDFHIDSFVLANEDVDSMPLHQRFKFSTTLNETGGYKMLPTTFFAQLKNNPFYNDLRFSDVNFGYRQNMNLNYYLDIPAGLTIDAMPKSVRMVNADKNIVFTRSVQFDEKSRKLISRINIQLTKSQYDVEEYPALQEFYKKMYALLEEQIVLKKS